MTREPYATLQDLDNMRLDLLESVQPPGDHPRRVTVSQLALQLASRAPVNPTSSVQLSLNAKGDVQIAVDVNDRDAHRAMELAQELFDALQAKYPRPVTTE